MSMQTVADILKKFNPVVDKYISREFQTYGIYLTETLQDEKHKSLYMKLAKTVPRALLERALSFVVDSHVDNKAKLFMWKMKELKQEYGVKTIKKSEKNIKSSKMIKKNNKTQNLSLFS